MSYVEDRIAISDALQRYSYCIDTFDWAGMADVFVDDATVQYHGHPLITGNTAIAEFLRERTKATTYHQHFVTVVRVDIDGDTASTYANFIAHAVGLEVDGRIRLSVGDYRDRVQRCADGVWRIAHRDQRTGMKDIRPLGT
jgi:ketosteroid isomerase-like protein